MATYASLAVTAALTCALGLGGCSGRTERGTGDAGPIQKPAAGPSNVDPPKTEPAQHLVMVVELEPSQHGARTLMASAVRLPLPRRRGEPTRLPWRVDVIGRDGKVLFSAPLADASQLRTEYPDANGKLSGATVERPVTSVTLRLPLLDNASKVRVVRALVGGDEELGRVDYPKVTP